MPVHVRAEAREPSVAAKSAILVDAVGGLALYEKDADTPRPPASTTKILTAVLLLENTRPTDMIAAGSSVADIDGSSLYLKTGERVSARDMLYALMLRSANDGCVAIAETIAGSVPRFADLMNRRAAEIGATNSVFTNPNGLPDPRHVTSARDLAAITRHAFTFRDFNEVVRTKTHTITRDPGNKDVVMVNHSKFLRLYKDADGVKTGYTAMAGKCFVGSATRNGWRLVAVALNSPDPYADAAAMLDYGFAAFRPAVVRRKGEDCGTTAVRNGQQDTVPVVAESDLRITVPVGASLAFSVHPRLRELSAPVKAGTPAGTIEARDGSRVLSSVSLVTGTSVQVEVHKPIARWWWLTTLVGALVGWGAWYGSAAAKAARIRRYRLKATLRNANRRG